MTKIRTYNQGIRHRNSLPIHHRCMAFTTYGLYLSPHPLSSILKRSCSESPVHAGDRGQRAGKECNDNRDPQLWLSIGGQVMHQWDHRH